MSFFKYFSNQPSVSSKKSFGIHSLTRLPASNFLCCYGEDREYFNNDFHDYVGHCWSWSHVDIGLEPPEEVLNATKEIYKHLLTRIDILGRLQVVDDSIRMAGIRRLEGMLTWRRIPIAAEITLTGENT
jgi:hypothetical protein